MRLRLGQSVHASDGIFGELADIVIDPQARTVTHIVAEPDSDHHQARLIPVWLLNVTDDIVTVSLDLSHVRQLQRVCFSDFVEVGDEVKIGEEWDVAGVKVIAKPYWSTRFGAERFAKEQEIVFDRIPKGHCEIRRQSAVITADSRRAGHVEGLLVEGEDVLGVIVRSGLRGLERNVVVPMAAVSAVSNDTIELEIDKITFRELPTDEDLVGPKLGASGLHKMTVNGKEKLRGRAAALALPIGRAADGARSRARDLVKTGRGR